MEDEIAGIAQGFGAAVTVVAPVAVAVVAVVGVAAAGDALAVAHGVLSEMSLRWLNRLGNEAIKGTLTESLKMVGKLGGKL